MIEACQGLAKDFARKYSAFADAADLEQEAMIGLVKATEMYQPGRATKFSSYAWWWMRKYVLAAIPKHAPLGINIEMDEVGIVQDCSIDFAKLLELVPSPGREVLQLAFGLNGRKPIDKSLICKRLGLTEREYQAALNQGLADARNWLIADRDRLDGLLSMPRG